MSHTPPVDSKGAAIDDKLEVILTKVLNMGVDIGQDGGGLEPWDILSPAQAKQAILAILAQEVKKARIDELTLINSRFSTVRGAPKHKEMIEGYMLARDEFSRVKRERIEELERLG